MVDEAIERLLGYHRRRYWLENGWSLRFRVWRTPVTAEKPHGMRYSLTLHDVDGTRLMGFDNAHGVGRETRFDHEHRYGRVADPVPYAFTGADALLSDFFAATERACRTAGVALSIAMEDTEDDDEGGTGDADLA